MTGVYSDETHGFNLDPRAERGPTMTPAISKFLDRDMDIALRKANFMAREANYTEEDVIHFVRVQMKRSYQDIHNAEWS